MSMSDVLVIGAGPFGLSISVHLRSRGIEHTIVGRPMNTWRNHMPLGLFLKSEPWGSSMSATTSGYDIKTWAGLAGFDEYRDRVGPLPLHRFLEYADWFTGKLVPDIRDLTVTSVTPVGDHFEVEFAEESPMLARAVIVATGMMPYAHLPAELSGMPGDLVTHSMAHDRLDKFRGKRVAVVGGGQSSLQTGALLHEAGADVQIVVRKPHVVWEGQIAAEAPGPIDRILRPPHHLCEGWACVAYGTPGIFRRMPESFRLTKTRTTFAPSGAWWLRNRVEGVIDMLLDHRVTGVEAHGSGVRLRLDGARQPSVDADHVIAGTGFRIDAARLPFFGEEIKTGLVTRSGFPLVNRAGESSVPGLYFAGSPTMVSLGPGVRFIAGTHHTAAQLARSVARRVHGKAGPGEPSAREAAREQEPLAAATTGPIPAS
jgi:FAD-dependent urate hydroxylase